MKSNLPLSTYAARTLGNLMLASIGKFHLSLGLHKNWEGPCGSWKTGEGILVMVTAGAPRNLGSQGPLNTDGSMGFLPCQVHGDLDQGYKFQGIMVSLPGCPLRSDVSLRDQPPP